MKLFLEMSAATGLVPRLCLWVRPLGRKEGRKEGNKMKQIHTLFFLKRILQGCKRGI